MNDVADNARWIADASDWRRNDDGGKSAEAVGGRYLFLGSHARNIVGAGALCEKQPSPIKRVWHGRHPAKVLDSHRLSSQPPATAVVTSSRASFKGCGAIVPSIML